ncbi:M28 family peptidase [Puteibacter caeruleilacunae]|nr:M28 family peptidase [Puteibacter caeruleilacunae]
MSKQFKQRTMRIFSLGALVVLYLTALPVLGQDREYCERIIEKLSAPQMQGRGYVKHGVEKAAKFLEKEMAEIGLKTSSDYAQHFKLDVNTYPGAMKVKVNGKELRPMDDYAVYPWSKGIKGDFKVYTPDLDNWDIEKIMSDIKSLDTTNLFVAYPRGFVKAFREDLLKIRKLGVPGFIELMPREKMHWFVVYSERVRPKTTLMMANDMLKPGSVVDISLNIKNKFIKDYETQNVVGYIPGKVQPDSMIVIGAHYDHLGCMGKGNYFPGANDNASGVAMVLDLARHFMKKENQPDCTIWFVLFGAEEKGLLGAEHFNENLPVPKSQVKYVINFDMIHTFSDHLNVFNGNNEKELFQKLKNVYDAKERPFELLSKENSPYSDHFPFVKNDIKALFLTTFSIGDPLKYHVMTDDNDAFSFEHWDHFFELIKGMVEAN